MKKILISLAVVMLVGTGIEVKAMKGLRKPVAPATTSAVIGSKAAVTTPALQPDIARIPQKPAAVRVLTEAEKTKKVEAAEKLIAQSKKLYSDLADLAISLGNKQDAEHLYKIVLNEMNRQQQDPDIIAKVDKLASLPLRGKLPLTEEMKANFKEYIDTQHKRGNVMRPSQDMVLTDINAKLDAAEIEHDDAFFNGYMNSLNWKK